MAREHFEVPVTPLDVFASQRAGSAEQYGLTGHIQDLYVGVGRVRLIGASAYVDLPSDAVPLRLRVTSTDEHKIYYGQLRREHDDDETAGYRLWSSVCRYLDNVQNITQTPGVHTTTGRVDGISQPLTRFVVWPVEAVNDDGLTERWSVLTEVNLILPAGGD